MARTVLFVGAGRHQRRAIRRAKELGLRVAAVDRNPDALGLREADVARVDDVYAHLHEALYASPTEEAILEEYIEGTEMNGIVIARDGEPVTLTLSDRLRP